MIEKLKEYLKEDQQVLALLESWTNNAQNPSTTKKDTQDDNNPQDGARSFQITPLNTLVKRVIFLTVAFPNCEYFMKYKECSTNGPKTKQGLIKYFKCMPSEQYDYVFSKLYQNFECMFYETLIDYDIFFEVTKNGNIHIHGRISFSKKILDKEIKLSFHRIFRTPTKYIRTHVDVKDYDHTKWNDYENKIEKGYQTTEYPHFKNI